MRHARQDLLSIAVLILCGAVAFWPNHSSAKPKPLGVYVNVHHRDPAHSQRGLRDEGDVRTVATATQAPTAPVEPAPDLPALPTLATAEQPDSPYAALVAQFFPDDLHMVNVAYAESAGWNENFITGGWWSASNDCGLMQIHMPTHESKFYSRGWDPYVDCFDPVKNLTVAREIYDGQGPYAWRTY